MAAVEWIVNVVGLYALVGAGFAAAFAWRGAGAVDANAKKETWGFRLMILPTAAALWPVLAWWWVKAPKADGGQA